MFLRIDKLQIEMPKPGKPDPNAAAAVQELLGGRFGEMSTLMNYTYQSFNFRGRDKSAVLRPDRQHRGRGARAHRAGRGDDQLAAHRPRERGRPGDRRGRFASAFKDVRDLRTTSSSRATARWSPIHGQPWRGDYVFSAAT